MLLREAVELEAGTEGLARLAREEGERHPEAYSAWVEAVARSGDLQAATAAAQEGVDRVAESSARARQADQLAELAALTDDASLAVEARRKAWRCEPSLPRLLALCTEGGPDGEDLDLRMSEELAWLRSRSSRADKTLAALVALLAAAYDSAARRLSRAAPLGWSRNHPGPVVFPFLALAASGENIPVPGSSIEQLWSAFPSMLGYSILESSFQWHEESFYRLYDPDCPEGFRPLLEAVLERHPPNGKERDRLLRVTRKVAVNRTRAIVTGKHRQSYSKAALLATACAEAHILTGKAEEGHALIEDLLAEFPRHYAFRREVQALMKNSPLLSQPY